MVPFRCWGGACSLAWMFVAAPIPTHAQVPPCEECIRLEVALELSTEDGPIVPSLLQSVVRAGGGDFLVSHLFTEIQVAVYDSTGAFVRMLGGRGEGPGEFSIFPQLVPAWGGGVYAFERSRLHRFAGDLRHQSTVRLDRDLSLSIGAVGLPGGRVVVDQGVPLPDGRTSTVSLLDSTGTVESTLESAVDPRGRTVIAPALDGGFWTIPPNDVELRKYSSSGAGQGSIRIRGSVVEPYTERIPGEGTAVRPRPRHGDVVEVGDGTLLVLARVADEDWEPRVVEGVVRPSAEDLSRVYSTVIQWIDASSGEIRGARLVRELLQPVGGAPGLLYSIHEGELGHVVTRLWRVSLTTP